MLILFNMKLRNAVLYAGLIGLPIAFFLIPRASALPPIPQSATLYMHIKHSPPSPSTIGKVQQIYRVMQTTNRTGLDIGLEPQVSGDWATQLEYYKECGDIPVMLNVMTSDDALQLTLNQIDQIRAVCNVKYLRFHEAISYYDPNNQNWAQPFPLTYALSVLQYAKNANLSVFWNEWDIYAYNNPEINGYGKRYAISVSEIIAGYEDVVAVSFGTNGTHLKSDGVTYFEPAEIFQTYLQQFQRRGASVQSWYWWERNGRVNGYELLMPPTLMRQHTQEAFTAGCEVVQYEPYEYFFTNENPKSTLSNVLNAPYV